MPIDRGIFSPWSNADERIVRDYKRIADLVNGLRSAELGLKIVLTSGSFDHIHISHSLYLEAAKRLGDLLIVGVDSDAKIKERKGPDRPLVPEEERLLKLCFERPVDLVVLKAHDEERWGLIKAARPDVLVLSEDTSYNEAQQEALREFCGEVVILPRMGTTTTSARLRQVQLQLAAKLSEKLSQSLPATVQAAIDDILEGRGG